MPFAYQETTTAFSNLEGIWGKNNNMQLATTNKLIKENLEYTIMIRQPNFITIEMVQAVLERVKVKKPNLLCDEIFFDTIHDRKMC